MRRPTHQEHAQVAAAFDAWTPGLLGRLETVHAAVLLVDENRGRLDLALASAELAADVEAAPWDMPHAGLPLGRLVDEAWRPSLEAAALVAGWLADRVLTLRSEAVQPFLYGRALRLRDVARQGPRTAIGHVHFVTDPQGRVLGLARRTGDEAQAVQPVADLGWYLREGG